MLQPRHLRDLTIDPATHPRGQPHLGAASGLVRAGRMLHLVADDEHHLGSFAAEDSQESVQLLRVRAGDLPGDKARRKRAKPDLEALVLLPPTTGAPAGRLLALGSGSTPLRERGFVLALDANGNAAGAPREVDLRALYQPLRAACADLNIEGAFVQDAQLQLLQRANAGSARNVLVTYALDAFTAWLDAAASGAVPNARLQAFELGRVDGVPYGWTDAAVWPQGGWLFSAVAEATDNSYADGACVASALGWVSAAGELQQLVPLHGAPKVEGIAIGREGELLMVTDADDPGRPSQLLEVDGAALRASLGLR